MVEIGGGAEDGGVERNEMWGAHRVGTCELVDEEVGIGEEMERGYGEGVGEVERAEAGEIFGDVGGCGLGEHGGEGGVEGVVRGIERDADSGGAGVATAGAVSEDTEGGGDGRTRRHGGKE